MNVIPGTFTYPPQNSDLRFDYRDSVVPSWVTNDPYPTEAVLTLWFYQTNWTVDVTEVVPANGSKSVALDIYTGTEPDYVAQFDIYYNAEDGSEQKYDSPLFHVVQDTGETSPVTYNQQALSTTLVASGTFSTRQATPTNLSTFNSATTSATTSASMSASTSTGTSNPSIQDPHLAMRIGLGVGITFGIAALGLVGFLYWKRKEKKYSVPQIPLRMSQRRASFVNEGPIMEELDGHQRHVELPVGPSHAELDCSRPAL